MPTTIGVCKEQRTGERRVSLDPSIVARLASTFHADMLVETNAGASASFTDAHYAEASITNRDSVLIKSNIVCAINPPSVQDINAMQSGSTLICSVFAHNNPDIIAALNANHITCFALELVPRITRAQSMDILSSQATVAGYKSVIMAADLCNKFFPMMTTAAGTIRPAKVLIIGVGVAGLQAIATAKRLGAMVEAYDVRPDTKEQIESLGAKAIELSITATGDGGYARELSEQERQQQQDELATYIHKADVLITTASVPGRPAPKIISASVVEGMISGSVIVDLAAESGGNCELTQAGKTITAHDVVIHGPENVASQTPLHASEMFAKNIFNFIQPMFDETGQFQPDLDDEVLAASLLTHDGSLVNDTVIKQLEEAS